MLLLGIAGEGKLVQGEGKLLLGRGRGVNATDGGVMAGMGGGGADGTALLARRSWLLVRGQRGVNAAAGVAEAHVVRTAKPCRWKRRWGGGAGSGRGPWGDYGQGASAAVLAEAWAGCG